MDNGQPPIGVDDLQEHVCGDDTSDLVARQTVDLINILHGWFGPMRSPDTAPDLESLIITACVTFAGCLHGEMAGFGLVSDLTEEAVVKLLTTNWHAGVGAGIAKANRHLAKAAAAELAESGQVPS